MNKFMALFILLSILFGHLFSKEFKRGSLSKIPLPTTKMISLYHFTDSYNIITLKKFLKEGKIFSFLELYEHFDLSIDKKTDKAYRRYKTSFRFEDPYTPMIKIAVLIPGKDIGSYSKSIPDSVLNYLIFNSIPFKVKVFDFQSQKAFALEEALYNAKNENFKAILLILTDTKMSILRDIYIPKDVHIFIPTVNRNDLRVDFALSDNLYFGGISYKEQIDELMKVNGNNNLILYSDRSSVSQNMTRYINRRYGNKIIDKKIISNKKTYYGNVVDIPSLSQNNNVFLNTPLVTSSILLSNFTYYNKKIKKIFSTQVNYQPTIFNLTQPQDRENLYIANSIINKNSWIEDYNRLFNNNVVYDWVNYTSILGTDFLVNKLNYYTNYYDVHMVNNQFNYDIEIVQPTDNNFRTKR